ncbi:hypothetical protein VUR80DRAFT_765 [Thermomyces stellatus]
MWAGSYLLSSLSYSTQLAQPRASQSAKHPSKSALSGPSEIHCLTDSPLLSRRTSLFRDAAGLRPKCLRGWLDGSERGGDTGLLLLNFGVPLPGGLALRIVCNAPHVRSVRLSKAPLGGPCSVVPVGRRSETASVKIVPRPESFNVPGPTNTRVGPGE